MSRICIFMCVLFVAGCGVKSDDKRNLPGESKETTEQNLAMMEEPTSTILEGPNSNDSYCNARLSQTRPVDPLSQTSCNVTANHCADGTIPFSRPYPAGDDWFCPCLCADPGDIPEDGVEIPKTNTCDAHLLSPYPNGPSPSILSCVQTIDDCKEGYSPVVERNPCSCSCQPDSP